MSAYEVKDALLEELDKGDLDLILLNFANPDMVGHSGMLEPTIKAIEAVDECLGESLTKLLIWVVMPSSLQTTVTQIKY